MSTAYCVLLLLGLGVALSSGSIQSYLPSFLYPPPPFNGVGGNRNPSACTFNGPQEYPTLKGLNFIENFGTSSCLTMRKSGQSAAIEMGVCSWNSLPTSTQLFKFENGYGGTVLKVAVSPSFGVDTCLSTSNGFGNVLKTERCSNSGKDYSQTWRFTKVRDNLYQLTQLSSNLCLKVDSTRVGLGVVPNVVRCSAFDNFQLWRICTSK